MGCALALPFARWPQTGATETPIAAWLKAQGFETIALAPSDDAIAIDAIAPTTDRRRAILLGSEGHGLPRDLIARCDLRVKIPMARAVDSLNVAAASAIAFWALLPRP